MNLGRIVIIAILLGCQLGRAAVIPGDIDFLGPDLQENSVTGVYLGDLEVVGGDPEVVYEFELVDGPGGEDNERFSISGQGLVLDDPLDFEEVGGVLSLLVHASDGSVDVIEGIVVITLLDDRTEDADNDGLSEADEEDLHGTSDLDFDSDDDGVGDAVEVDEGTVPSDQLSYPDYPVIAWGSNESGSLQTPFNGTFATLTAGGSHMMARNFDGSAVAWGGEDAFGQITVPPGLGDVLALSAGGDAWSPDFEHNVALVDDGSVSAWGFDGNGQASVPSGLDGVPGAALDVSAGRAHSLALLSDGTVEAWGSNSHDQITVPAGLDRVIAVDAGGHFSLALRDDGTVVTWGEVYDGSNWVALETPAGLRDVVAISAGWFHALALRGDGSVVAWGSNSHGQADVPVEASGVISISAGGFHSLALTATGTVLGWGLNDDGQATVPPTGLANGAVIEAGSFYSMALLQFGTLPEVSSAREIVVGPAQAVNHAVTVNHATALSFQALGLPSGLSLHPTTGVISGSLASPLRASARLLISTDKGRVEQTLWIACIDGEAPTDISLSPAVVVENGPGDDQIGSFSTVDADPVDSHVFELVDGDGADLNSYFRIENGMLKTAPEFDLDFETVGSPIFVRVRVTDSFLNAFEELVELEFVDDEEEDLDGDGLSEGEEENEHGTSDLLADTDGDGFTDATELKYGSDPGSASSIPPGSVLISWGNDDFGQLPVPDGLGEAVAVSGGDGHSLALMSDGTVVGWGADGDGQATPPVDLVSVKGISAGGFHSLALLEDGTVRAWGSDSDGQATVPLDLDEVIEVAAGKYHSLALKGDGTLVAWGRNVELQSSIPPGIGEVVAITAGDEFSAALVSDGTVVTWGTGAGSVGEVSGSYQQVIGVAAGARHGLALRGDGTVFGWGESADGQLVVPSGLTEVVAIAAGDGFSAALEIDGEVTVWGDVPAEIPFEAEEIDRISAGGRHLLSFRRTSLLPEISPESKVEASEATDVDHPVLVTGGTPQTFSALGLPDGLSLNPASGVITGIITTGEIRAVRLSVETDQGATSRVLLFNTQDGVPPSWIHLSTSGISENAPGSTVVGSLTADDVDPLDSHSFVLVDGSGGTNNLEFLISGNQLEVAPGATLDFELLGPSLSIRVMAIDSAGKSLVRVFEIELLNDWTEDDDMNGFNESEEQFQAWAADLDLFNDDALPDAQPFDDGVMNLVRYALPVEVTDLTSILPAGIIYEAEDAEFDGPLVQEKFAGFTGNGYLDFTNLEEDFVEWTVLAPGSQSYELGFRYDLGSSSLAPRPLELRVNGELVSAGLNFTQTGPTWSSWATLTASVDLDVGLNQVRLTAIGSSGANIDHLIIPISDLVGDPSTGGGASDSPVVEVDRLGDDDRVRVKYIRRRNTGLVITAMHGPETGVPEMEEFVGSTVVTVLDSDWEFVVTEQTIPSGSRRFFRLRIEFP